MAGNLTAVLIIKYVIVNFSYLPGLHDFRKLVINQSS
jgi:hypothetical protein